MDILLPHMEVLGRLALALLLGVIIGIERNMAHKTAGMRTFALITLGAALFAVISGEIMSVYPNANLDPSRIASSIVTGMGFLAGGIIIFNQKEIQGLTTGAAMWVAAAIGMAAGFGLYAIALWTTILTVFILAALWNVEAKIFRGK